LKGLYGGRGPVVVGRAGHLHIQKPGLIMCTFFGPAAAAAFAAASACAFFTCAMACIRVLLTSGSPTSLNFSFESVTESVIGFECHMNALPLPECDWPSFAS
jgi:hypothetical protein